MEHDIADILNLLKQLYKEQIYIRGILKEYIQKMYTIEEIIAKSENKNELLDDKLNIKSNINKLKLIQMQDMNEYEKIVLANLESRISILEEENEKYISNY